MFLTWIFSGINLTSWNPDKHIITWHALDQPYFQPLNSARYPHLLHESLLGTLIFWTQPQCINVKHICTDMVLCLLSSPSKVFTVPDLQIMHIPVYQGRMTPWLKNPRLLGGASMPDAHVSFPNATCPLCLKLPLIRVRQNESSMECKGSRASEGWQNF